MIPAPQYVFFGGKGGAGKTTCAAAAAIALADHGHHVLVVSTDPAHSLGDVLGRTVTARPAAVRVRRAPTGHTLRLLATPALIRAFAGVLDVMQEKHRVLATAFGRGQVADASVALIVELARDGERLGALLRDPARMRLHWVMLPHAVSSMGGPAKEMPPRQAHAWVRQLMTVVLKCKAVVGFEHLATELVSLSQGLKRLQAMLTDARVSGFIAVTRPEELPSLQTLRLVEWLRRHALADVP